MLPVWTRKPLPYYLSWAKLGLCGAVKSLLKIQVPDRNSSPCIYFFIASVSNYLFNVHLEIRSYFMQKCYFWKFYVCLLDNHPKHLWYRNSLSLKVGSTRRAVSISYGRRCEANVTILEKLVWMPKSLQFLSICIEKEVDMILDTLRSSIILRTECTMSFYFDCFGCLWRILFSQKMLMIKMNLLYA